MISHTYTQNTQQQADAKHVATTTTYARLGTARISPMTAYWLHVRWRSLSMIAWQVDSTQRLNGGLRCWAACFRLLRKCQRWEQIALSHTRSHGSSSIRQRPARAPRFSRQEGSKARWQFFRHSYIRAISGRLACTSQSRAATACMDSLVCTKACRGTE